MEPARVIPFTQEQAHTGDLHLHLDWGGEVVKNPLPPKTVKVEVGHERTRESLGSGIEQAWGVENGDLLIAEFGEETVARVHRRLLRRRGAGDLRSLRDPEAYFIQTLWNRSKGIVGRRELVDERGEEYLRAYQESLAARGNR